MQLSSTQEQTGTLGPTHKKLIIFLYIGALHEHLSVIYACRHVNKVL